MSTTTVSSPLLGNEKAMGLVPRHARGATVGRHRTGFLHAAGHEGEHAILPRHLGVLSEAAEVIEPDHRHGSDLLRSAAFSMATVGGVVGRYLAEGPVAVHHGGGRPSPSRWRVGQRG